MTYIFQCSEARSIKDRLWWTKANSLVEAKRIIMKVSEKHTHTRIQSLSRRKCPGHYQYIKFSREETYNARKH